MTSLARTIKTAGREMNPVSTKRPVSGLGNPIPPALVAVAERRTPQIVIKMVEMPEDLTGIESLNQRVGLETEYCFDDHHHCGYWIAQDAEQVVGMASMIEPSHPFAIEKTLIDASLVERLREQACEFRCLVFDPAHHVSLNLRLADAMARCCMRVDIPYVFVGASAPTIELYRQAGFVPFDRPFINGQVRYQPMVGVCPGGEDIDFSHELRRAFAC